MNPERRGIPNKLLTYLAEHPKLTALTAGFIGSVIITVLSDGNSTPPTPEFKPSQPQIGEEQQPETVFKCGDQTGEVKIIGDIEMSPGTIVTFKGTGQLGETICEPQMSN